jgi:two-component system, chemotaxis family, CheB/CheR fusion protein
MLPRQRNRGMRMTDSQTNAVSPLPICAIGASAGGVTALQHFFSAIDVDLGLSYVVVIHLSPDHPSQLGSILAGRTKMPVEQVEHTLKLRPNCVYVVAPDRELAIEGDDLVARPIAGPRSKRAPIDGFFRSVAATHRDGLAVVLSGSGSDGALGIRAMKEAGGVVFVQDPNEAEFAMMPQSAIATGAADFVAPVRDLVQRVGEVVRSKRAVHELTEDDIQQGITKIIGLLHARTGHDFSHYKRTTVMRRVARRMQVSRNDSIGSYINYLRSKPEEAQELLADLLISVTSFFRDRDAFGTLARKVIQPIFKRLDENMGIRVWVLGCATGEEAYSIAMLLLEEAARGNFHVPIQIFASDLDEKALLVAREGRYPKAIAADVSEERLRRFFVQESEHYRIRKEVRDLILFASHSVLKDPPFIRLDLVSCRNLLIYLDRELQQQLCSVLQYALKPNGYLFLGSAESLDSTSEFFRVVDRDARLYAAKPIAEHAAPVLPQFAPEPHRAPPERGPQRVDSGAALARIHASVLERQSPPSALVDKDYRLRHLSPTAGRFLRPSEGLFSTEVWRLVRPELRLDLKLALQRAFERKESTITLPITMEIEGRQRRILEYVALTEADTSAAPYALVLFLDAGPAGPLEEVTGAGTEPADEKRRLVQELTMAQERLNASQKQYEEVVQESRASNEELQSINEEYRSTAEELETSKEELQSVNEELKTVNAELKSELENVSTAHSDLQNLMSATEIGTLFLDQQLRIKLFTPPIAKHFNITDADLGRVISDFTHRLRYDNLENDAKKVLESLAPIETEIRNLDDRWLMMRMQPYRTVDNLTNGIVVTFSDVTELKRTEALLATELTAMTRLQQLSTKVAESVELEPALLLVLDTTMELLGADLGYIQLYDSRDGKLRIAAQRGFEKPFLDHFAEVDASNAAATGRALATRRQVIIEDIEIEPTFIVGLEWAAQAGFRAVQTTPLVAVGGKVVGIFSTHFREPRAFSEHDLRLLAVCARQASDSIHAYLLQDLVRKSENRMRQVLETEAVGVFFLDAEDTIIDANSVFLRMTGYSRTEVDARELSWREMTPDELVTLTEVQSDELERSGLIGPYEKEYSRKDGSRCWMLLAGRKLDDGIIVQYVIDITDRKRAEQERELLTSELSHRVKNTLAVIEALASQTTAQSVKEFREKFAGRIQALAQAHTLLFDSDWSSVDLKVLLQQALSAYHVDDARRVLIDGAPIALTPKQALGLRLMMHELATNAIKFGAFSTEGGTVHLSWQIEHTDDRQRQVRVRWEERGGPTVKAPRQSGFGVRLINTACEYDLEGEARLDYPPEGLICEIVFPTA